MSSDPTRPTSFGDVLRLILLVALVVPVTAFCIVADLVHWLRPGMRPYVAMEEPFSRRGRRVNR